MDKFSQRPFSPASLQQLLEELENFVALESQRNSNPWISTVRLTELFRERYRAAPESAAKALGYGNSLRSLLRSSDRFSIYGTQNPQEFYVKVNRRLPETQYYPKLIPKIRSIDELKFALTEIVKSLTRNNPKKLVTIATLSKKFCDHYKQPIRTLIRSICPDIKLIELLQTTPNLHIQKIDNDWQITVNAQSVDRE